MAMQRKSTSPTNAYDGGIMMKDRRAALLDTDKQPALALKNVPVAQRGGLRRFVVCGLFALCLAVLIGLILVYVLVSLPEWLSLLTGITIVLVFVAMIVGIGVMTHAPSDWE